MILTRFLLGLVVLTAGACTAPNLKVSDEQSQRTLDACERFYEYKKKENYDSLYTSFSREFNRLYSKDEILIMMKDVKAQHGSLSHHTLIQTRVSINVDGREKEKVISNVYKVLYSSGFLANEEFMFILGADNDDLSKIDGYTISRYEPEN